MTDGLNKLPMADLRAMARGYAEMLDDEGISIVDLVNTRACYQDAETLRGVIRGARYLQTLAPDEAKIEARDSLTFTESD